MMKLTLLSLCLVLTTAVAAPPAKQSKKKNKPPIQNKTQSQGVEWFNPSGTVKDVRQVKVRFTDDMVAFGDPRPPSPFDITCPAKGTGRWIDNRNWVFDFEADLPAGLNCQFVVKKGLKSLAGKEVGTGAKYSFSTGGPAIKESRPYQGGTNIEEDQAFVLKLNAVPKESFVIEKVYFSVEGIPERIGVNWIGGKLREQVIKQAYFENVPSTIVLQAKQRFPSGSKVSLVWPKGILSETGVPSEEEQNLPFIVREAFTAEFSCERENADADCVPFGGMSVRFSAAVPAEMQQKVVLKDARGKTYASQVQDRNSSHSWGASFHGPFPESTEFTVSIDGKITDEGGRSLENADRFPLKVRTAAYPPLAKFAAPFGILEAKGKPALPVTLRNLEPEVAARLLKFGEKSGILDRVKSYLSRTTGKKAKVGEGKVNEILFWLKRVEQTKREHSIFAQNATEKAPPSSTPAQPFTLPKRTNPKAFEVIGIPFEKPGFYVVELESETLGKALLGQNAKMYVPTAVLVTNLAVHFKWGRESSLVWVTTLDGGKPVADAKVEARDCSGKVFASGKTTKEGWVRLEGLPKQGDTAWCAGEEDYSSLNRGLLVTAEKADDMSFVHSTWDSGIEPWRYSLGESFGSAPKLAHTVLARSLVRAGETLHMKHFVRRHSGKGILALGEKDRPNTALIEHQGSEQRYRLPLKWDALGTAENTWPVPKEAKLGSYSITLVQSRAKFDNKGNPTFEDEARISSGFFRVEEFRVPLMKAVILTPPEPLVAASQTTVDLSVSYLNGGGASEKPVKLSTQYRPRSGISFPDDSDYTFANGATKEGRTERDDGASQTSESQKEVKSQELTLDKTGTARSTLSGLPAMEVPYDVHTELQYSDPNGEVQTVSSDFPVYPSNVLVGLKTNPSDAYQEAMRLYVKVVDLKGKPLAQYPVTVDVFERKYYSHRKRIVGGFYAYEHSEEIKRLGPFCAGKTDEKGLLECEGKSPVSGYVLFEANAKDKEGRRSVSSQGLWVSGDREWWFAASNHDRMDVIADSRRYEPGQTAKFQVRSPFRSGVALISVEREGVMDVYVRELSGKHPVVEIPVKPNYAPNVFVSVLAVRGRAGDVKPSALVDLGRPAFKLGIAEIKVGWRAHDLAVSVKPEKSVYRVREKAAVKISVRTPDGKVPSNGEVAVAVVDEGLLELMPNQSWKLLEGLMGQRGYEVSTATAQMQVIGKRHFGLKAVPTGGGGGEGATRELFDTLLLWQARVKLDKKGEARVSIPLNDSLTSFRIVAVAHAGVDRFGHGSSSVRSTQDLMMFSGIPPVVREGDKFRASFTLRNATTKPMEVGIGGKYASTSFPAQTIKLAGGESREAGWDVSVPAGVSSLSYEVEAKEKSGAKDRIKIQQKIASAVPVRTFQATVVQLEKEHKLNVELPKDALQGRGEMRVHVKPSLLAGLEGVKRYLSQYPYTCLEQQISRAVVLRDEKAWKEVMDKLPSFLDGAGLAKYFPTCRQGSDTLTSYLLAIAGAAGWEIPADSREKMMKGLSGFVNGSVRVDSSLMTADLALRKLSAIEALTYHSKGGADPKLLGSILIQPNLWPSSGLIDWISILNRSPKISSRDIRLKEAMEILRARLSLQGTTLNFSTEKSDRLWWLMTSPDGNAVRALHVLMEKEEWKEDMPRLVKGSLGRQRQGHWDLTTANAWGVLAIEKFASRFEKTPVSGVTRAALAPNAETLEWKGNEKGKTLAFPWPARTEGMVVTHDGPGKPWLVYEALAAIPLKEPLWAGYRIKKSIEPLEQKISGKWTRGDLARVKLTLQSDTDMTWVVVSDPVPGGSAILGSGLGRDSSLSTQGEKKEGWVWPVFEERSFEAYRSYYEWVPKGEWTTEYTIRLNNGGNFQLPTTRVEAMYSPETFGELPNAAWEVVH